MDPRVYQGLEAGTSRRGNKGINCKEKGKKPVKAKVVRDDLRKSLAPCSKWLVRETLISFERMVQPFSLREISRIV